MRTLFESGVKLGQELLLRAKLKFLFIPKSIPAHYHLLWVYLAHFQSAKILQVKSYQFRSNFLTTCDYSQFLLNDKPSIVPP